MNTHTVEFRIATYDTDAFNRIRPDAVFRMMQEVSGEHSALLGLSRTDLIASRNMVWMILRAQAVLHRLPGIREKVSVTTWFGEPGKLLFPRYVRFADESGALLAAVSASWALVDLGSRHIVPPEKAGITFPPAAPLTSEAPEPGKLHLRREGAPLVTRRAPLYSDIDVNMHLNNIRYIGWMMDLFPLERHARYRLGELSIGYQAEVKPDEQVEISLYQCGDEFEVQGAVDRRSMFEARGLWVPV